jgi:pimeloyl-ACP methyl ester carboxylesterase
MQRFFLLSFLLLSAFPVCCGLIAAAEDAPAPKNWPDVMRTVKYPSPIDNTEQPAVVFVPEIAGTQAVPLLVTLHSWSGNYTQPVKARAEWVVEHDWALISPNFRGQNDKPEGCGSELAVADIVAAVDYMKKRTKIDTERIYLIGGSGGGYGTMLLAGRHPEIWAGASAWCGISDLKAWHTETEAHKLRYAKDIEKSCGGPPGTSPAVDEQYRLRSANTWIAKAVDVPLDINHGIHDGHSGSVFCSHSISAFNLLAEPSKRISDADIQYILTERKIPESLQAERQDDPLYGKLTVLFRRVSGNTRLTLFNGGHSDSDPAALRWLSLQRKGKSADWSVAKPSPNSTVQTGDVPK